MFKRLSWLALFLAALLLGSAAGMLAHAAPPPEVATLEEASYLERWKGDLDGAERIYRALLQRDAPTPPKDGALKDAASQRDAAQKDTLSPKDGGPEIRAEALFRLGALLVRRGSPEGEEVFRTLAREHAERRDLLARADLVLVPSTERLPAGATVPGATVPGATVPGATVPGATVPGATVPPGLRAKVIARRPDGLFAFPLGARHGLETGRRCVVLRDGKPFGVGLVLRLTPTLAAAKLETGEVLLGDEVEARARPSASGAPAEPPGGPERAESARLFLDAIAVAIGPRAERTEPPADPSRANPSTGVWLEARAIGVDASFLERLPFPFERCAPGRLEAGALPDEGALAARLDPEQERLLVERVLRAAAPRDGLAGVHPAAEGEARVHRAERVLLRTGKRVEVALTLPGADFQGVRLALQLSSEPRRRPGALSVELAEIEVDLLAVQRPREPVIFPGKEGPLALSPPLSQRIRPLVRLSRERPAVVLAGLQDPFSPAAPRRELLLTLSLVRGPGSGGGLDR